MAVITSYSIHYTKLYDYSFQLTSDDGSALWIGNQLIVDNDGQHTSRTYTGDIALNKGKYPIKVDYFDYTSSQTLVVKWKSYNFV